MERAEHGEGHSQELAPATIKETISKWNYKQAKIRHGICILLDKMKSLLLHTFNKTPKQIDENYGQLAMILNTI